MIDGTTAQRLLNTAKMEFETGRINSSELKHQMEVIDGEFKAYEEHIKESATPAKQPSAEAHDYSKPWVGRNADGLTYNDMLVMKHNAANGDTFAAGRMKELGVEA